MPSVNLVFVASLAVTLAGILAWGFKNLPRERWQFLAVIPVRKDSLDQWRGLNLTTYGLINAGACLLGVILFFILLGSISVPSQWVFALIFCVLAVAMPASRLIAKIVEKKAHTFTVGGASFSGLLVAPLAVLAINQVSHMMGLGSTAVPMVPALAALSIAYSFGEGLGRLACISFGCCYGRPWADVHPLLRFLSFNRGFVFAGKTKKVAYEGELDGKKVVPIQAVTSVIHVTVGLVGLVAFLASSFELAFGATVAATQIWRAISELFRSDYRGGGSVSAYQKMAVLAGALSTGLVLIYPPESTPIPSPDIIAGMLSVWSPLSLLAFQALGLLVFYVMGRSRVTGSSLSFHVRCDRI